MSASKSTWMRFAGAGMELAATTLIFGGLGALIDQRLGMEKPLWSALGGALGFTFGMYRFIRLALAVSQSETGTSEPEDPARSGEQ